MIRAIQYLQYNLNNYRLFVCLLYNDFPVVRVVVVTGVVFVFPVDIAVDVTVEGVTVDVMVDSEFEVTTVAVIVTIRMDDIVAGVVIAVDATVIVNAVDSGVSMVLIVLKIIVARSGYRGNARGFQIPSVCVAR